MTSMQVSSKSSLIDPLPSKKLGSFPIQLIQFNPKLRNINQSSIKKPSNPKPTNEINPIQEKNPYALNNSKKLFDVSFKPLNQGLFQVPTFNEKPSEMSINEQIPESMDLENHIEKEPNDFHKIALSKKRTNTEDNSLFSKKFKLNDPTHSDPDHVDDSFAQNYSHSVQNSPMSSSPTRQIQPTNDMYQRLNSSVYHEQPSNSIPSSENVFSNTLNRTISSQFTTMNDFSDDECNVDEIQEYFVQHTGKLASSLEELAGEMEDCKDNLDDLSVKLLMINNEILLMNNPILNEERTKNVEKLLTRFYEE